MALSTKLVTWWEYACPECDHTVVVDEPFPPTTTCPACSKTWHTEKLRVAGYLTQQRLRVPK